MHAVMVPVNWVIRLDEVDGEDKCEIDKVDGEIEVYMMLLAMAAAAEGVVTKYLSLSECACCAYCV